MSTRATCVGLLALVASAREIGAVDVQEIVRKVQARYDSTQDFTAAVTQEMTVVSLGKTITSSGTVAFKKPGKMRWEFDDQTPQVIVADGTTVWIYQPTEHQVIKAPFDSAFRSSAPLSFLTGVGRIAEDFDVSLDAASVANGGAEPLLHLSLVPRHDAAAVGTLRLAVVGADGEIRGAEVADPMGNVSRLRFDGIRRNQGLKDAQFVFEVPPGVDVITPPARR